MKLETIKKNKKKKIIIGGMIVLSVIAGTTLTTTRAKYKSAQSLKLASGIVNYKASDLHIVAIKTSEDGTNYNERAEIPTSGYTLNTEKSKCRIPTSTLVGEDAPVDESIPIEYKDGRVYIGINKKNTKCYLYFDKLLGRTSSTIIADFEKSLNYKGTLVPTFSISATSIETEENNGIYKVADDMYGGYSYYWRGAATTNHVIFDNKCWRIVRINGDESARLIYNGTPTGATCPAGANSATVIMGSTNEEKYYSTSDGKANNPSYVGWTYTLDIQRTTTGTESNIKAQMEKWYESNISADAKSKVDTKGKFCNDRNVGELPSSWDWTKGSYVTSWSAWSGDKSKYFAYAGAKRLWEDYSPSLSCETGDVYQLSAGAITADEVMLAGGINKSNSDYYLYATQNYWTMTPNTWGGLASVFIVKSDGCLNSINTRTTDSGIRPVINLRSDVTFNAGSDGTFNAGSDGTSSNPYIVQ